MILRKGAEVSETARQLAIEPATGEAADCLSVRSYERLSTLISRQVGIKLPPQKRTMVEGRLRRRMRSIGIETFDAYCSFLFEQNGLSQELPHLIDVVTTNKTDFFREPEHYQLLQTRLVPSLLAERKGNGMPLLKIWSAASSNGAEAYTIAMVLADLAASSRDFRFSILGTDISNTMLRQAERAIYPITMVDPVPSAMRERYLMRARDQRAGSNMRIVPELRRVVRFSRLNLMDSSYPLDRDIDVIFLRNVLIYFEKKDQEAVIARMISHLRPKGFLLLGHSESMIGNTTQVRQVAPAVFQKTKD